MQHTFYRILTYTCIGIFILYWTCIFLITLPTKNGKEFITNTIPRFNAMFGYSWKLFTPPFTFNVRLYFITRNLKQPNYADTLEVLENIALQKQRAAPFNQKETIIDYMVNTNVHGMIKTIWAGKDLPITDRYSPLDSLFINHAVEAMRNNKNYLMYLANLKSFSRVIFEEKRINTAGKELKIIIKKSMITPFKDISNKNIKATEIALFETDFIPINK